MREKGKTEPFSFPFPGSEVYFLLPHAEIGQMTLAPVEADSRACMRGVYSIIINSQRVSLKLVE
jgi:hypothetical protein